MKLFEILKSRGLFSKDILSRFKNKQIKVNGESVDKDFNVPDSFELDSFENLITEIVETNNTWTNQLHFIGIDNIIGSNIETTLKDFLLENLVVKTSKKDSFVIRLK